ncbi:type II secretion system secretin GspD, partial [bacterium]|nr:type II secretion system secretin GspD [bacterium]
GNITILSSRKVTIGEAWNLYISALEASGYGIIENNGVYRIVDLPSYRRENTRYVGTGRIKPKSGYVVAIVLLSNADSELMKTSLQPLVVAPGIISSYDPSNALIITDTSENVSRITKIAKQLDEKYKGSSIKIFQPKYIRVKELATALTEVYQANTASAKSKQQVKISAYEPTNTLIISAPAKDFLEIEEAINKIDDESRIVKSDDRNFRIYYLQNADAEDVTKSLSSLLEEKKKLIESVKKEQAGTEASKNPETVVSTKIASDKATNSVIFYSTEKEYNELVPIIQQLDVPRKQILISAIIAETQLSNSLDAGIAWQVVSNPGILASFMGGLDETGLIQSLQGGGFIAGAIGNENVEISSGGSTLKVPKLYGIIKALETKGNFNLLSTPRVVTHDHKMAKLSASKNYPFATGTKYDTNNNPIISYDYKDIGLNLEVTPHVGQNDQVRLDLNLKLADLVEWITQGNGSSQTRVPVTSERSVNNTVTLSDGETIVIGGLIDESTTETIRQVPILSKIPLIGGLFKDKSVSKSSRTLFVFLTPHIIDDISNMRKITDKYGRSLFVEKGVNEEPKVKVRNFDKNINEQKKQVEEQIKEQIKEQVKEQLKEQKKQVKEQVEDNQVKDNQVKDNIEKSVSVNDENK